MKKLFITLMAMLCVCTMGVAAIDGDSSESTSDSTDVLYEVSEGYTWNIHAAIDFDKDAGIESTAAQLTVADQAVAVTRNIIGDGKKLQIVVDAYSCNQLGEKKTDHVFQVANGNSELAYSVTGKEGDFKAGAISVNDVILEVNSGVNVGTERMTFVLDTAKLAGSASNLASEVAGKYFGKISYTASIVNQ